MGISEEKMKIVINNYFKSECNVNTSIREAFEKGFRIGVKKGASTNRPQGEWIWQLADNGWADHICSACGYTKNTDIHVSLGWNYCPNCGADMREESE